MRALKLFLFITVIAVIEPVVLIAQTCSADPPVCVPANGYAFQYAGDTDHGLRFNLGTQDYEFTNNVGSAVLGIDALTGDINLGGNGALLIGPNRYAFRYTLIPEFGLFFNGSDREYQFLNGVDAGGGIGQPIFRIQADSGHLAINAPPTSNDKLFVFRQAGVAGPGKSNIYAYRFGTPFIATKGGSGWSRSDVDAAIKGFSNWGNQYSAALYGAATLDYVNSAAIVGYSNFSVWGSICYRDSNEIWSGFFNGKVNVTDQLSTNKLAVENDGNVGGDLIVDGNIGVRDAPVFNVDVQHSGPASLRLKSTDDFVFMILDRASANDNAYLIHRTAGVSDWYVGTIANGNYSISQSFASSDGHFTITKDSTVGINNASPNAAVDLHIGNSAGGSLQLGSVEQLLDGGSNTIESAADIDPDFTAGRDLGQNGGKYWDDVNADDFINLSDRRVKSDVRDIQYGINEVMQLKPVSYVITDDPQQENKLGLIAQEVLGIIPEVVKTHDVRIDEEGNMETVELNRMGMRYNNLIPVLINSIQEQQNQIEELVEKVEEIERLKIKVTQLEEALSQCCTELKHEPVSSELVDSEGPYLGQNIPNPFENTTTIKYYVPENSRSAMLIVSNINGKEIANFDLHTGTGSIEFSTEELASGTYVYSLAIDEATIMTKKMILSK